MSNAQASVWNLSLTRSPSPLVLDDADFPRLGSPAEVASRLHQAPRARALSGGGALGAERMQGSEDQIPMEVITAIGNGAHVTSVQAKPQPSEPKSTPTAKSPVLQGVAASMHAPHNRQPSPIPLVRDGETQQTPNSAGEPAGGELVETSRNRFELLADMSPNTAEMSTRLPSKKARGKKRAHKRRRTASTSSESETEGARQPISVHQSPSALSGYDGGQESEGERGRRSDSRRAPGSPKRVVRIHREPSRDSREVGVAALFAKMSDREAAEFRRVTGCVVVPVDELLNLSRAGRDAESTMRAMTCDLHSASSRAASVQASARSSRTPATLSPLLLDAFPTPNVHTSGTSHAPLAPNSMHSTPRLPSSERSQILATGGAREEQNALGSSPRVSPALPQQSPQQVAQDDVPMEDAEDPLFQGRVEPIREHIAFIPFTRPSKHHRVPLANHPDAWYNNMNGAQMLAWKAVEHAILVRMGLAGYQLTPALRRQTADLILSILRETFGELPDVRISIPSPHHAVQGANMPPFAYLLWNITPELRDRLLEAAYITSERGVLFFTSNQVEVPRLVTSIAHFENADEKELKRHLNDVLTKRGIDQYIRALVPTHPDLSLLPADEAVRRVRESMEIEVVKARQTGGADFLVAHVYIDPPTPDPVMWTPFRDMIEGAPLAHPLLGMDMAIHRDWRCKYCHSTLHPSGLCHLLTEPGWILPPSFQSTSAQTQPPVLPPAPAEQEAPVVNVYTTVAAPQTGRGGATKNWGRGRGAGKNRSWGQ